MRFSSSSSSAKAIARLGLLSAGLILPLAAQDDLPEGKGKETLENTCTECHGLDKALNKLRTTQNWRAIATAMRSKGATMSDDELKTLVEYLSQNFGLVETKIDVNTASAKELRDALQLTATDAAAIARYREAKGRFKEWRDLLKVPGVDKPRLEAVKDRITFKEP